MSLLCITTNDHEHGMFQAIIWFFMFFTGHLLNKHSNQKLKHFVSIFGVKSSSASNGFLVTAAKMWSNVLDTDDEDADWLLGGAKAEPINWRCRISLKARQGSTSASRKICWARNQDGLQACLVWMWQSQFRSLSVWENPTRPLIGLGASSVDLKFASLNTKVRLRYLCYCFATIYWNIIPDLVGSVKY